MKLLPVIALLFITACGSDDSDSSSSEASTELKPLLWSEAEYSELYQGCYDGMDPSVSESFASGYCHCVSGKLAREYEIDVFIVNQDEILEREEPTMEACFEKHSE